MVKQNIIQVCWKAITEGEFINLQLLNCSFDLLWCLHASDHSSSIKHLVASWMELIGVHRIWIRSNVSLFPEVFLFPAKHKGLAMLYVREISKSIIDLYL